MAALVPDCPRRRCTLCSSFRLPAALLRCSGLSPVQHETTPACLPPWLPACLIACLLGISLRLRVVSGTSLAAVLATAISSAYTYSSAGCVDLGAAALISPAAMLTAPFGARLTSRLDCTALRRILGYFLLAAAPLVPLKAGRGPGGGGGGLPAAARARRRKAIC